MIFTIAAALIALLAALLLARPYLRGSLDEGLRRRRANVLAYEGRVAEIGDEVAADVVRADAAEELRQEAAAQLLETEQAAAPSASPVGARRWSVLPLLLAVVTVFAAIGYLQDGSWRVRELIDLSKHDPAAAERRMVDQRIIDLERRLARAPQDAEGWAMLGHSYVMLGRSADAAEAWSQANRRSEAPQADWLVAEGEARAMASEPRDLASSRTLFERAHTADPRHPRALLYLGLAAAQMQDYGAALDAWLLLRAQELPPEIEALLDQRLPQLAQMAGREWPPAGSAPATGGPVLLLDVSLAPELQSRQTAEMTLFVYARAEQGPPMPLAVQRIAAPTLPVQVRLDDSQAMTPTMRLSQFERWTVVARLSRSGGAEAAPGDLEGRLNVGRDQAGQPLRLVMDRVLP